MTCVCRSHMMLPCSLWSVLAWEALWASISLMAEEQVALASWMIWPWVVFASLTTAEQAVLVPRITQEQLVLASRVNWEYVVWTSSHPRAAGFGFSDRFSCLGLILTKFHTQFPDGSLPTGIYGCFGGQQILKGFVGICPKLHWVHWGSDASGPRSHSNRGDAGGDPPREASATSALTWNEVSTGWSSSSDFWDGGTGTITGLGLLGVEFFGLTARCFQHCSG